MLYKITALDSFGVIVGESYTDSLTMAKVIKNAYLDQLSVLYNIVVRNTDTGEVVEVQ